MKPVILLRLAEQEMLDAKWYYEQQVPGLGQSFMDNIDVAVQDIAAHPFRWPVIRPNIRRRLVHRFPYGIFYRVDQDEIVILAIAHLRRRPMYWLDRL